MLPLLPLLLLPLVSAQLLAPDRIPPWKARNDLNWGPTFVQPEQVHIAIWDDHTISVTWISFDDVLDAIVEWGKGRALDRETKGNISLFVAEGVHRYVSRVHLDLSKDTPGDIFRYRVGSAHGWSAIYEFRYLKPRDDGGYEIIMYGDMGNENARSMGMIQKMAQNGDIDLIHHVGDYGYDLNTDKGRVGDEYFRQIESAAAYVPYMPTVGNHENADNFTHYVNRFTAPGGHPIFYSYDLDQVHFISFSTEVYFYTNFGKDQIQTQYNWLVEDLKKANANRQNVPWIVTLGHRPMYCSDPNGDDCKLYQSIIRTGLNGTHKYALEELFYHGGVDLSFWAHEHEFERLYPVFNRTVYKGAKSPYVDPPAPVHITSGSAGCREEVDPFIKHPEPWSAYRSSNYGFGLFRVFNATHLRFRQVAAGTASVEDEMWLVKHRHGPYGRHELKKLQKHGKHIPLDHREL